MIQSLLLLGILAQSPKAGAAPVRIGAHYTDALAGLAVYRDAKQSVLLNIGWVGRDGKAFQGYKALMDAKVHFGEAAPDDSYHRISWSVGSSVVTYEWGLQGKGAAVGRISSTGLVEIRPSLGSGWPGSKPVLVSNPKPIVMKAGSLNVSLAALGRSLPSGGNQPSWSGRYMVDSKVPMTFAIGTGTLPDVQKAGFVLDQARKKYNKTRLWAEGDWGDFLSPLENQLGNSKIYGADTGRLAHIVSRNWCLPDGQVLFCWDSFFNGLMASLDDPVTARDTVRAIIAQSPADGFVPNYGGRGWGVSVDRSQPPVGSYCVWKMNQRDPDVAFLREVYPKLLRWHRWWFAPRGPGKKPNRDGNGDGLLEWGSNTGDLQNAKFESGLDDSPMFDDGKMVGPNMDIDSTDLNALWAMDAEYLSRIAEKIGRKDEANKLRKECQDMAHRMDRLLWNESAGVYGYRYWTPKAATEDVAADAVITSNGKGGLRGEYFKGQELEGTPIVRHDKAVHFNWGQGPVEGIGQEDYSVRWTGVFKASKSGPYVFDVSSDDGCRLWIGGKKLIDGWSIHPLTKYETRPIQFKAGEKHAFRLEYFQAKYGAEVHLAIHRTVSEKPAEKFSPRVSPLNFYPLIAGAPSKERARRALNLFFRPDQFGGEYVCPTISKNDPAYPAQGYWRGTVWGPTSYLTYQGLRKYATNSEMLDYAEKSVNLFMKNWIADGSCHENFNSITGWGRSDPHYTWGALLCLVGLEQLCDTDATGKVVLNGASGRSIQIHNLRIQGRIFEVIIEPRKAVLMEKGKVVAVARGKILTFDLK